MVLRTCSSTTGNNSTKYCGRRAGMGRDCSARAQCPRAAPPPRRPVHLQREAGLPLAVAVIRVAHGGHQAVYHPQVQHLLGQGRVVARQDPGRRWGSLGAGVG